MARGCAKIAVETFPSRGSALNFGLSHVRLAVLQKTDIVRRGGGGGGGGPYNNGVAFVCMRACNDSNVRACVRAWRNNVSDGRRLHV